MSNPYREPAEMCAETQPGESEEPIVFANRLEECLWREWLEVSIRSGACSDAHHDVAVADCCLTAWRERGGAEVRKP